MESVGAALYFSRKELKGECAAGNGEDSGG